MQKYIKHFQKIFLKNGKNWIQIWSAQSVNYIVKNIPEYLLNIKKLELKITLLSHNLKIIIYMKL